MSLRESLCMSCKKPCRALRIPVLQGTASCVCKVQAAWLCMTTFSLAQEDVLCTGSGFLINSITFIGMLTGRENGKVCWILLVFWGGGACKN